MSLQKYSEVVYCPHCKMILIEFREHMIEYHSYERFWAEDGELEGKSEYHDIETNSEASYTCVICKQETNNYVLLKAALFKQILKYCYKDDPDIKAGFPIELQIGNEESGMMIAPTIQEIKEAMLMDAI